MALERTRSTAQAQAEGLRVFVAGVPWHILEETLRRDFEECGVLEDLFLMKDHEGYSRGRAFLTFRDKEAVEAALKFDNTEYAGRTIYVKVAEAKKEKKTDEEEHESEKAKKPQAAAAAKEFPAEKPAGCKSVCLKNIGEATEEDVRGLLKKCTSIQSVRVVYDRTTGAPRGIAFVDFREKADVDIAMKKKGKELCGNEVHMAYEAPRERPRPEGCMQVAIKKLPASANETDIKRIFKGLKSLSSVRVIRDKEGNCKGLAFAEFTKPEDVEAAVQRDGMKVKDSIAFICFETKVKKGREDYPQESKPEEEEPNTKKKKKKVLQEEEAENADDQDEEVAATVGKKEKVGEKRLKRKREAVEVEEVDEKPVEDVGQAAEGKEQETPKEGKKKKSKLKAKKKTVTPEEADGGVEKPNKDKKKKQRVQATAAQDADEE